MRSLAANIDFLRRFPKLPHLNGFGLYGRGRPPGVRSPLTEVTDFGANPGALRMFTYLPPELPSRPALVVVLHGCGQDAATYDHGAGWSTLAKRYGFALLMPQQQEVNNANACFNWFSPEDTARDQGEAASIRRMIDKMVHDHNINRRRICITGLSAGGAMTSVMLATHPELFAAGAIIAGLPFGIAGNMREALNGMMASPSRPGRELGDLVRNASNHRGPWPRLSVWHGSADRTVHPGNADEIVKQWLDVHGLPEAAMSEADVDGHPRQVWWNAEGQTLVESYTISGMAHGTPLGLADNDERYGAEGAFLIEAGISSSYHIAKFFGLTKRVRHSKVQAEAAAKNVLSLAARERAKPFPAVAPVTLQAPDPSATPWPRTTAVGHPKPAKPRRGLDVSGMITRALTAAGLRK
ncbi:PHB depolymerase family esterase [Bradyrhizobium sp.]|uniref:extracellular catalytic domain type 1 short-chain-length polyhydroxyalkanoate depolymerase n=1 Tax=Bradyrhizobium sp. TaxID=376 RepID=UPI001D8B441A|nr:PHB depolymerase family esterase [Bradyrhizobium sp.]MBI5320755.1 PHB depolymerase family esterase [Bradyrhizobium sp.]